MTACPQGKAYHSPHKPWIHQRHGSQAILPRPQNPRNHSHAEESRQVRNDIPSQDDEATTGNPPCNPHSRHPGRPNRRRLGHPPPMATRPTGRGHVLPHIRQSQNTHSARHQRNSHSPPAAAPRGQDVSETKASHRYTFQ